MHHPLLYPDQAVVRAHVEISVGQGKSGHVGGRQPRSITNQRPESRSYTYKSLAQGAGKHVTSRDQHGIGIDFDGSRGIFK